MAVPTYQDLMRPVLDAASGGEVRISDVVDDLAKKLELSEADLAIIIPSGKQTRFANRVHWAKSYLKQAGLVKPTRRAHFVITDRGREALESGPSRIDNDYLFQFEEFKDFKSRSNRDQEAQSGIADTEETSTPDERLRSAHKQIESAIVADLLDRVREGTPSFFENLIVELLLAMGYGGSSEDAGQAIGGSGDDGVDGVIDQDPLGVDQIYVQAKRYKEGNNVGAGAIRDFFGALNLKKAQKGIFFTTSKFSGSAIQTARDLGMRIVLIDGEQFAKLMLRYNIGCRDEEVLHLKKIDEEFFDQ